MIAKVVKDKKELEEVFRIRLEVYSEMGYVKKEDYPSGLEIDKFDDNAVHFIVFDEKNGRYAATDRLVRDGSFGFPLEEVFREDVEELRKNLKLQNRELGELCRIAILKEYRGSFAYLLLTGANYIYGKMNGLRDFCFSNPLKDEKIHARLGCGRLSKEVKEYPSVNYPYAIAMYWDLEKTVESFKKKFEDLYKDGNIQI
jgi:N-acyl-L-homoserine lactone synthetase